MDSKEFIKPTKRKVLFSIILFFIVLFIYANIFSSAVIVFSDSMYPSLKKWDVVFYERVTQEQINKTDIIIYRKPYFEYMIVSRVVDIKPDGSIATKGDNNIVKDSLNTTQDDVIGKAKFSIPFIGIFFVSYAKYITLFIISYVICSIVNLVLGKRINL